ncbi:MAG: hypothetical protein JWP92_988 [Caulobacter sp.]|nr:hypothetical protein [Caulobacter sp.]
MRRLSIGGGRLARIRRVPPWAWALALAVLAGLVLALAILRLATLRPAPPVDQPRAVVAHDAAALLPEAQRAARLRGLAGQLGVPLVVRFRTPAGEVSPGLTFAWTPAALGGVDLHAVEGYQLLDLATYTAHSAAGQAAMDDWCRTTVYGAELTPALCAQAEAGGQADEPAVPISTPRP